jgi:broad specificity phosphatase PhoE
LDHPPKEKELATTFGLLRHGQTEWNVLKKIQGSKDSPLTAKGKEQTSKWAKVLTSYGWDRIIGSDQGRVRETVSILNRELQLPVTFDRRLREQHWGVWEGMTIADIQEKYREDLARRVAMGWKFSAPGGETRFTVRDRILTTLLESAKESPGQKILVVCHQGVVKAAIYSITGREFLPGEDPLLQHNKLHIIRCTGQDFAAVRLNIAKTTDK